MFVHEEKPLFFRVMPSFIQGVHGSIRGAIAGPNPFSVLHQLCQTNFVAGYAYDCAHGHTHIFIYIYISIYLSTYLPVHTELFLIIKQYVYICRNITDMSCCQLALAGAHLLSVLNSSCLSFVRFAFCNKLIGLRQLASYMR